MYCSLLAEASETIQILQLLMTTLVAISVPICVAYIKVKFGKLDIKASASEEKVTELHTLVNSRMTQLVNEVRSSSFAAGEKSQLDSTNRDTYKE